MSTSNAISMPAGQETMAISFEKFAGGCTIAAGVVNFLYAVILVAAGKQ